MGVVVHGYREATDDAPNAGCRACDGKFLASGRIIAAGPWGSAAVAAAVVAAAAAVATVTTAATTATISAGGTNDDNVSGTAVGPGVGFINNCCVCVHRPTNSGKKEKRVKPQQGVPVAQSCSQ
jgi:hypothetical protein